MKSVVTENYEIECGNEQNLLAHLASSDDQKSEAGMKTIYYLIEFHYKTSSF